MDDQSIRHESSETVIIVDNLPIQVDLKDLMALFKKKRQFLRVLANLGNIDHSLLSYLWDIYIFQSSLELGQISGDEQTTKLKSFKNKKRLGAKCLKHTMDKMFELTMKG